MEVARAAGNIDVPGRCSASRTEFTEVPNTGHFISLERLEVPASLLNACA